MLEFFEERVAVAPDSVALACGDERVSYRELDVRANRVARFLAARGVGPEVVVGCCLGSGVLAITGLLGIMKAGGAYLPIDPRLPAERRARMLADAGTRILLGDQPASTGCPAVSREEMARVAGRGPATPPARRALPDALAYVVYTSGSTGRPKGIAATRKTIANAVLRQVARGVRASSCAQLASIGFDVSLQEILITLLTGGTLVLAGHEHRQDPARLLHLLATQHIGRIHLPPVLLTQLAHAWTDHPQHLALQEIFLAGDTLQLSSAVRAFLQSLDDVRIENQYGPSETHHVTSFAMRGEARNWPASPPIGQPIASTRVYLLDQHLRPVPPHAPGEIYVSGHGLARGYTGQPALTAHRFIASPFATTPGQRMYRTGDLARWNTDGQLEFLGRIDDQVKIRGNRVEPAEIQATLTDHPAIREAAVITRPGPEGQPQLAAYLVPAPGHHPPAPDDLRAHARTRLPDYMIPATFTPLPALPLTPNGKLDQNALPPPAPAPQNTPAPPATPHQQLLADLWSEVLHLPAIGIDDNFFALGGHSLLATQITTRLATTCHTPLPLQALFDHPTIRQLATHIETITAAAPLPIDPDGRPDSAQLSFAQRSMWFLEQLQPSTSIYNVATAWRLAGPLAEHALQSALQQLAQRHDNLRTRFDDVCGEPCRVIDAPGRQVLSITDLSGWPVGEAEREALSIAGQEAALPFDLQAGPLTRAHLIRISDDLHYLLLNFHHFVIDGLSQLIFWRELSSLYDLYSDGTGVAPDPLGVKYADYVDWQNRWLETDAAAQARNFWSDMLQGAPQKMELPADYPHPRVFSGAGRRIDFTIPHDTSLKLRGVAQDNDSSSFSVLITAFALLLASHTGQDDLVVGVPAAGRTRQEFEGLIGFFVNSMPLRLRMDPELSFVDLLRGTRTAALQALTHQDVPFELIVEDVVQERDLSHNPLFQVWFDVDSSPRTAQPRQIEVSEVPIETGSTHFDLEVLVADRAGQGHGFTGYVRYCADLFSADTVGRLVRHFQEILEAVASGPSRPGWQLADLGPAERDRILAASASREADVTPTDDVMLKFEERVAVAPDSVALACGDERVSYRELDVRANRVARFLAARGVGPEVVVGCCLGSGVLAITGLLGIMKAGGAYLPIDPRLPAERRARMLADAGTRILLGDQPASTGCPAVSREEMARVAGRGPATPPARRALPDALAYVVYTSGSTGRPKGIAATRKTIANAVLRQVARGVRASSCAQLASIGFDVSLQEILITLLTGGTLVLAGHEHRQDPARLLHLLATQHIGRIHLPPVLLTQLAHAWTDHPQHLALQEIFLTGDTLRLGSAVTRLLRSLPGVTLENQYGPSEGYHVTSFAMRGEARNWPASPPIGQPIASTRVYLLDQHLRPVPPHAPGEIYVSGHGLARGYTGQPALTAHRFIASPFATTPGQRMYRTGDLARWNTDGQLEFLGRIDDQVKIRGNRVEPAEIQATLTDHPAIREAAVITRPGPEGQPQLAAYLVPAPGHHPPAPDDLRAHARTRLPDYMIPATFTPLPALPLTPNGKLDQNALPPPAPAPQNTPAPPATPHQQLLADLWSEVLHLPAIGIDDNFFALGGHSLLATQITTRLATTCHTPLPLQALFDHPTIRQLATHIETITAAEVEALPLTGGNHE